MRLRSYLGDGAVGHCEVRVQSVAHAPVKEVVEIQQSGVVLVHPHWGLHGPVNIILSRMSPSWNIAGQKDCSLVEQDGIEFVYSVFTCKIINYNTILLSIIPIYQGMICCW